MSVLHERAEESHRLEIPAGLGPPIKGPTAIGDDPRRFWRLTWTLAVTDFKLRFFDSVLGYLWTLMKPLMLFGVLYVVFTVALNFGASLPDFPVALLLGIVMFSFLAEASSQAIRSIVGRENLVRKVDFPRLAVPLASVLTACFSLGLNLVPVLVFGLASGVYPRWSWFWFLPLLAILLIFVSSICVLLSALYVRYRDVEPIWEVTTQILFYASCVFFPINTLLDGKHAELGRIAMANPFAAILEEMRHVIVSPKYLGAADAIGQTWRLVIPAAIIVAVAVLAARVFVREAPRIAEDL
jgi:ABC-2 type transport system permease protein